MEKAFTASHRPLSYFCKKNHGLLSMKLKVPVKDNTALALVYTPGVGKACKEIEANASTSLIYTNKANSILLVTDSSAYLQNDPKWKNDFAVPILEADCIYYKNVANIDAYPMILDLNRIKNDEDVYQCISELTPAYSGFELIGMTPERVDPLLKKIQERGLKTIIYTTHQRRAIREKLSSKIPVNFVSASILRAALDLHVTGPIPVDCIYYVESKLQGGDASEFEGGNIYRLAAKIARLAAEFFLDKKMNTLQFTPEQVEDKLLGYYVEGPRAWIADIPEGYLSLKHSNDENSLELHRRYAGVCETHSRIAPKDFRQLNYLFSEEQIQEVVDLCKKDEKNVYDLTCKNNFCGIITNGTAVLGFGAIGAEAGLPVMEGKSALFKQLGGVDVMPICLNERNVDKLVDVIAKISPMLSAINLEDIKAPECFEIESRLQEMLPIPVFHDDQHGTAIVTVAGLVNSLKLIKRLPGEVKVVINGGGAAGISITEMLLHIGVKSIIVCDTKGAIYKGRKDNMNKQKDHLANLTNKEGVQGTLMDVIKGTDVFIGVSAPGVLSKDMIKTMGPKPIIFALANPVPEIMPDEAAAAGAFIVATGRSDFPNQVNNSLAFPGIFRGALDIQATKVNMEMKVAAAYAIASLVQDHQLTVDNIMPNALDLKVPQAVARAVAEAGIKTKINRRQVAIDFIEERIKDYTIEEILRPFEKP